MKARIIVIIGRRILSISIDYGRDALPRVELL